jgi:predicted RNA-binding Zn ribbon-like protein
MGRKPGNAKDIAELNNWARDSQLAPQLDRKFHRHWLSPDPVNGALASIACQAVELLTGPERELIRECAAAPACSLLYLDRSRGRRRRWCEMERCGSRAKMAGYRQRQATGGLTPPSKPGITQLAGQPSSHTLGS